MRNKMKTHLTALLLIFIATHPAEADAPMNRAQWKSETIQQLQNFQPAESTTLAEIHISKTSKTLRYELEQAGLIRLGTNGWVYIKMHSADNEQNPEIGDISLAIDHTGSLYQNDGHVCGGITLKSSTGNTFKSIDELLEVRIMNQSWRKIAAPGQRNGPILE